MSFVPESERIPGIYQRYRLQASGGFSLGQPNVLMIGYRSSTASSSTDLVAQRLITRSDATALYGVGSQLDVMARSAFDVAALARQDDPPGSSPRIWAMGVAPPSDGADEATVDTIAFTGTATRNGTVTITAGQESVAFGVLSGDTNTTTAARGASFLSGVASELCATFAANSGSIVATARENGVYGNQLVFSVDTSNAPGLSATITRTNEGVGVVDLTLALDASLTEDYDAVLVSQDDAGTASDVKSNIQEAWDFTVDQPRYIVIAQSGDLSDAQTTAASFNTSGSGAAASRVIVANAEILAGAQTGDLSNSARTPAYQIGAGLVTRLYSQARPNWNYNGATVPGLGRPRATLDRATLNSSIAGGVTVIVESAGVSTIVDPVNASTTDQVGDSGAPDTRWQPFEITRTIRAISRNIKVALGGFTQADSSQRTQDSAKSSALRVLRAAAEQSIIKPVQDDAVTVGVTEVGGSNHLSVNLQYSVIVGIDVVAVTHDVVR